jgi:hypothetical protein
MAEISRILPLTLVVGLLAGCHDDAARRAEELQHERELARIDVEKKQRLLELEAEAEQRRAHAQAEAERQRIEQERAHAVLQARQQEKAVDSRVREAVASMELSTRGSFLDDGTQVLILRNLQPYSVDLNLRCFTRSGASKTLFVSVPARGAKEVGFLEGWAGNFVSGERCEMLNNEVLLREFSIR